MPPIRAGGLPSRPESTGIPIARPKFRVGAVDTDAVERPFSFLSDRFARVLSLTPTAGKPLRWLKDRTHLITVSIVGWCLAIALCSGALAWSARRPGQGASPPERLPESITSGQTGARTTVIVAIHPRCPCSRATVANLESAWRTAARSCDLVAVVYAPGDRPVGWAETDTVKRIAALDGARRINDPDGSISAALGVWTSGQVLVYDANGKLRFSGGITPSAGHEGDCASLETLRNLVGAGTSDHSGKDSVLHSAVFGCPLCDDETPDAPATARNGSQP